MSGQTRWKHGSVEYPLTSSTSNALLLDADPALSYAIELFSSALETYVAPRLLAQAALEELNFPSAVVKTVHFEPTPFLLSDQIAFPLFCLYRTEETWAEKTISFGEDASTWEWAYVLPPMTPRQIEQLHPILRTVAVVMRAFAHQSFDPGYAAGATLRDLSGIQKMIPGPTRYGQFEAVDEQAKWWRAVTGKLIVYERDRIVPEAFDGFDGVDAAIDETSSDGTQIVDLVDIASAGPPVLESIAPVTGSKAGNTLVTITGSNFRLGTTPRVLIGGAYAGSVTVQHATRLQCLTPAHDAYPAFDADVQVIAADDQLSNTLAAAFQFTTP